MNTLAIPDFPEVSGFQCKSDRLKNKRSRYGVLNSMNNTTILLQRKIFVQYYSQTFLFRLRRLIRSPLQPPQ